MSTFGKKVTSALLASAIVLTTAGSTAGVSAAYDSLSAANKLASNGVIVDNSTNPTAYNLGDTISRQEALKVLIKLSGKDTKLGTCESPFADIADTDWACKYAVAALAAGYISPNENFRPLDEVSKAEALKMVMQARGIARDSGDNWQAGYVSAAIREGVATESFTDYNTASERGTMFIWAANALPGEAPCDEISALLGLCGDVEPTECTDGEMLVDGECVKEEEPIECDAGEKLVNGECVMDSEDILYTSLSPLSPSDGLAQSDVARVPLLAFEVKAGSQDVTLDQATLEFIGLADYKNLDDVAIYAQSGERVSKMKSFSEVTREISFDNDIVVEAGNTVTYIVAGKITTPSDQNNGAENATYGVKLIDLQASSTVEGEDLVGALLVPAEFANVALLEIKEDAATGKIQVGEDSKLAGFSVEEKNDNEDVLIKSFTFHVSGSEFDEDDVSDLSVLIDGEEVISDLYVNSDEEIIAPVDYTLEADSKIDVELRGTIIGSIGGTPDFEFLGAEDVYSIGEKSNMPVEISNDITDTSENISDLSEIEGSEINVSFDKSDIDEALPDSEDVLVGTLNVSAVSDYYTIDELRVTVSGQTDAIDEVKLDGNTDDGRKVSGNDTIFTFKDISIKKGEDKALDLTVDLFDNTTDTFTLTDTSKLTFDIEFVQIDDDENDVTYNIDSTGTEDIDNVLSVNSFNTKTIDINEGNFEIINVDVIDRDLVLGNGIETVLYKAKINIGDADDLTIDDLYLEAATDNAITDFDDVIAKATLNIGGETFDADIEADKIKFSNNNAVITSGSKDVEVLITAVLKENDSIANGTVLALQLKTDSLTVEDSEGDDLANVTTTNANNKLTQTNLLNRGTFEFAIIKNGENKDDIEGVVLAGSSDVALAEYKMEADLEDVDVNSLKIKVTGEGNEVTAAGSGFGATESETATAREASAAVARVVELETKSLYNGVDGGVLSIKVDGTKYSANTYADLATAIQANSAIEFAVVTKNDADLSCDSDAGVGLDGIPCTADDIENDTDANTKTSSKIDDADGTNDVIRLSAANAGTSFTLTEFRYTDKDGNISEGSGNGFAVNDTQLNSVEVTARAPVKTYTFPRAFTKGTNQGDTIDVKVGAAAAVAYGDTDNNGDLEDVDANAATNSIEEIAAAIQADAAVVTATVSGNVITVTGNADGATDLPAIVFSNEDDHDMITTAISGTDLSDTLKNIELKDTDGNVITNGGTVTFVDADASGTETAGDYNVIEFEDFTVVDGDDQIEGTLVADIENFTTNGDETTAQLGKITVEAFSTTAYIAGELNADVEGANSNKNITTTIITGNEASEIVDIVPVIVTATISDEYNEGDNTAEITFNIDKGSNTLDNDDIRITNIQFENNDVDYLDNAAIRNDDGTPIIIAGVSNNDGVAGNDTLDITSDANGLNEVVSGDKITLTQDTSGAVASYQQVVIIKNGITFSINSAGTYTSSNEEIIDLGSYKD